MEHVEVGSFNNDQHMLQGILGAYRTARREHEWQLSMLVPSWTGRVLHGTALRLGLPGIPTMPKFLVKLISALDEVRFHKLDVGHFVKVCIVLVKHLVVKDMSD